MTVYDYLSFALNIALAAYLLFLCTFCALLVFLYFQGKREIHSQNKWIQAAIRFYFDITKYIWKSGEVSTIRIFRVCSLMFVVCIGIGLFAPMAIVIAVVYFVHKYVHKYMHSSTTSEKNTTLFQQDFDAIVLGMFQAIRELKSRLPMLNPPIDVSDLQPQQIAKSGFVFTRVRYYKINKNPFDCETLEIIRLHLQTRLDNLVSTGQIYTTTGNWLYIDNVIDCGMFVNVDVLFINSPSAYQYRAEHSIDIVTDSEISEPDTSDEDF